MNTRMRKKVVFVIGQLGLGGGEKQLFLLLSELDLDRFEPIVFTFNVRKGDYWEEQIRQIGIDVITIRRYAFSFWRVFDLWYRLWVCRPQVVVSWSLYLNFVVAIACRWLLRIRCIGSIRCDLYNKSTPKIATHRYLGTKLASIFVVNSSYGREVLVSKIGLNPGRVKVIFNAVKNDEVLDSRRNIRREANIPESWFVVLNVGRLEVGKNQIMLLRVLKRLVSEGSTQLAVAFVGSGDQEPELRKVVDEYSLNDHVFFLGNVPRIQQHFSRFQILCHCSIGEGMPNVIAEAALSGLPVVATKVSGVSDLIIHGKTGFQVEIDEDDLMTEFIRRLYTDGSLYQSMKLEAAEHLRSEQFSVKRMIRDFQELF